MENKKKYYYTTIILLVILLTLLAYNIIFNTIQAQKIYYDTPIKVSENTYEIGQIIFKNNFLLPQTISYDTNNYYCLSYKYKDPYSKEERTEYSNANIVFEGAEYDNQDFFYYDYNPNKLLVNMPSFSKKNVKIKFVFDKQTFYNKYNYDNYKNLSNKTKTYNSYKLIILSPYKKNFYFDCYMIRNLENKEAKIIKEYPLDNLQ